MCYHHPVLQCISLSDIMIGACPSADDYLCTFSSEDEINVAAATFDEKEEDIKAAGEGYGSCDPDTGANGAAYARCTEHCCTTYGADLSYNQDIVANYGRTVCQAGMFSSMDITASYNAYYRHIACISFLMTHAFQTRKPFLRPFSESVLPQSEWRGHTHTHSCNFQLVYCCQ